MMDRRMELAEETRGMAQGPMPARDFMNEFLPWNDTTPKKFRSLQPSAERLKDLTDMATASEAQTYELFLKAFSGWPFDLKPGEKRSKYAQCVLQWNDSHATPDKFCDSLSVDINAVDISKPTVRRTDARKLDFTNVETHTEMKPKVWDDPYCDGDAASYGEEDDYEDIEQYASDDSSADEVKDEGNGASDGECEEDYPSEDLEELDIANDEDLAENMTGEPTEEEERADDTEPSPDEDYPFDNGTLCGQRTRGQICAYAGATMTLQFRTHLFTVVIFGSYVRLLRWDRSSVILILAQRGRDPRISIPTQAQGQAARKAFRRYAPECWRGKALDMARRQMSVTQLALLRLTVGSGNDKRVFIIGTPDWHQGGYSPFGRATRHGMAYCELNKKTFFYKDYWREDAPHTIPESEVYHLLAEHEILHVAQMELGGDSGFETIGHGYASKAWARAHHQIRRLIGHLIVLITKGRPLESFETGKQLVSCVADAMEAHQKAYALAGLLHRDISVGNIMMTLDRKNRRGILIDWDHCVLVSRVRQSSRISRTGTWQFVSAHLLDNPNAEYSIVDDRESALYVLVWVALRNLRHSLPPELLKDTLSIFDKYVALPLQRDVGGKHKCNALIAGTFGSDIGLKVPGLEGCFAELCEAFAARYKKVLSTRSKTAAQSDADRAVRALQKETLAQLENPSWFYETLGEFAGEIKEPPKPDVDWFDNMEMVRKAGRAGRQKRGLMDKQESHSKRFRGRDGIATPPVSLDQKVG
ncbi:hypothetical protein ARMSODRAFT_1085875 [Armillaria solidipes]|uniref:Fungal-type protein kinase domain-containing protein n=1 Tax=Armillaria solidipes TaxID=1076256 RepID=A0A2H3BAI0_9AGAR|nr:hypothetical protein ARMSODRAFT_1085875 [Armillaria solidipes]